MQNRLPRSLTSVYRLFLRTGSASVLHHVRACVNIRKRWRPVFDAAAKVVKELQQPPSDAPDSWKEGKIMWLKEWNERIDHTLEILYNSATSRGLPHKVTRNLANIFGLERRRVINAMHKLPKWHARDPSIPQVPKRLTPKILKKLDLKREQEELSVHSMHALGEVIRMAEATAGLTLGRNKVTILRWIPRRQS